jgi:two-component sensor histidine kinase
MTAGRGSRAQPGQGRLASRFAVILALALLPIGAASVMQTRTLEDELRNRAESGLLGATLQVAEHETSMIRAAQGMVAALAQALPDVAGDAARCQDLMRRLKGEMPQATLIAFVPMDGQMRCSSVGRAHDFTDNPNFLFLRDQEKPSLRVSRKGSISQTSILAVTHPVRDAAGKKTGYAVISLPHSALEAQHGHLSPDPQGQQDLLFFWSFDRTGEVMTANIDLDEAARRLPAEPPLAELVGQSRQVFQALSRLGNLRTYAVAPVIKGELYLMSSWRNDDNRLIAQVRLANYLTPLLMWSVGLLVAAWAAERLVTRHVRTLHRAITRFAQGDRRLEPPRLRSAPAELRDLGAAYRLMTENITRGEAELEDLLHQKEVLLREVHHRVKNNLQLIASIMNIQIRKTTSQEAKSLLKDLRDRVMSLATIHRGLYQTSGQADVTVRELFSEIIRQISGLQSPAGAAVHVALDVDELRLAPEQAVPLALLMTEAVSAALNQPNRPERISVALHQLDESTAKLEVNAEYPDGVGSAQNADTGIGLQLMTAFAQQLGATPMIEDRPTQRATCVTFHLQALRRQTTPDEHPIK